MSVLLGICFVYETPVRATVETTCACLSLATGVDQVDEVIEEGSHVVRSGAGLRVALKAESRPVPMVDPLQRAIEKRAMGRPHAAWQALLVHRESMILAGDHHAAVCQVRHGMIGTMVSEFHLERPRTAGQTQ